MARKNKKKRYYKTSSRVKVVYRKPYKKKTYKKKNTDNIIDKLVGIIAKPLDMIKF